MDIENIRKHCLSLPHATEQVQWGYDLVFKVDGKMFAVAPTEVAPVCLSFKCSPENFAELCERPGIIRPPTWRARSGWRWSRRMPFAMTNCVACWPNRIGWFGSGCRRKGGKR